MQGCALVALTRGKLQASLFARDGRRFDSRYPPPALADTVAPGPAEARLPSH